jgi:hypothetical protein
MFLPLTASKPPTLRGARTSTRSAYLDLSYARRAQLKTTIAAEDKGKVGNHDVSGSEGQGKYRFGDSLERVRRLRDPDVHRKALRIEEIR